MLLAVWVCRRYILEYLGMKEVNEDVVSTGKTTGEGTHTHRHTLCLLFRATRPR
jgi:hypothetical protein